VLKKLISPSEEWKELEARYALMIGYWTKLILLIVLCVRVTLDGVLDWRLDLLTTLTHNL
jgi:hypothetical protein